MWTSSARALAELHATYVDAVNRAVTAGRDELVAELEQDYLRECDALLRTSLCDDPAA